MNRLEPYRDEFLRRENGGRAVLLNLVAVLPCLFAWKENHCSSRSIQTTVLHVLRIKIWIHRENDLEYDIDYARNLKLKLLQRMDKSYFNGNFAILEYNPQLDYHK